ncbi:MAG TPA: energy-coupling factor ABC transporter substrate-binding protein [Candidatus Scatomonas pullistercoris]|uniref:Cobalt transport protein CbiN n=1 Tax=Candidatus Scatomonas pullistercoris TaxID=2840920 RepID=A0A9D1TAN6_9FIRM|nr:energy-coupling factor ABC transporter substrate-binding protein [Candidatus Scatomonas pullistercoris]
MSRNKKLVIILLLAAVLIAAIPFFALRGASFGGTDDAASELVEEISPDYEPWTAPVLENAIGGELPGEVESLLFCVQTGIGVGVIAFFIGRFYERKKLGKSGEDL